jgi:hypothetical protein
VQRNKHSPSILLENRIEKKTLNIDNMINIRIDHVGGKQILRRGEKRGRRTVRSDRQKQQYNENDSFNIPKRELSDTSDQHFINLIAPDHAETVSTVVLITSREGSEL